MSEGLLWIVTPSYDDVPSFMILRSRILDVIKTARSLPELAVRFIII